MEFMKRPLAKLSFLVSFAATGLIANAADPAPAAPAAIVTAVTGTNQPHIQFETPVFDFGKVTGGAAVNHVFVFTNTGDAVLEITAVQPSCGCTAAGEWSKKVEPGMTGFIPIQFNSGNYGGQVTKTVTVTSNDKTQPTVLLQIRGLIWKPVDVTPQYAVLQMTSESVSNATTTVRIVNNQDQPLTLSPPESNNRFFTAELKTNQPGKEFELIIRTAPPFDPLNTQGTISIKTSATNIPTISVTAMAMMQPALVLTPDRIVLPSDRLDKEWSLAVTVRNQLSAALKLTEPTVNAEGVKFEVKETEPGRVYTVVFTFPAGFQLNPANGAEFSAKSSHEQTPVVKIPIANPPAKVSNGVPANTPLTPRATQAIGAAR